MRAGAESSKSRGGEEENNTRGIVWAAFGPVSRVVMLHGFKLMDSRFRSTTVLYSVRVIIIHYSCRFTLDVMSNTCLTLVRQILFITFLVILMK